MADDPCSLQYCKIGIEEFSTVTALSVAQLLYLGYLQLRRHRGKHYVAVRLLMLLFIIGRMVTVIFEGLDRHSYAFFVSLMPIALFAASLQWANQVVTTCCTNVHMAERWMHPFLRYTRVCQISTVVIFPTILVGFEGGTSFNCNEGSIAFLVAISLFMYLMGVPLLIAHRSVKREVVKCVKDSQSETSNRRSTAFEDTLKRISKISISVSILLLFWTAFVIAQFVSTGGESDCDVGLILALTFAMGFFVFLLCWHTDIQDSTKSGTSSHPSSTSTSHTGTNTRTTKTSRNRNTTVNSSSGTHGKSSHIALSSVSLQPTYISRSYQSKGSVQTNGYAGLPSSVSTDATPPIFAALENAAKSARTTPTQSRRGSALPSEFDSPSRAVSLDITTDTPSDTSSPSKSTDSNGSHSDDPLRPSSPKLQVRVDSPGQTQRDTARASLTASSRGTLSRIREKRVYTTPDLPSPALENSISSSQTPIATHRRNQSPLADDDCPVIAGPSSFPEKFVTSNNTLHRSNQIDSPQKDHPVAM